MEKKIGLISILSPSPVSFLGVDDSLGLAQCSGEKGGNEVHILGWVSANMSEHNCLLLTPCEDKMCRSKWERWLSSLLSLGQIRCHLTQDGFQFWHILLSKSDARMKIELLERTNVHPSSDQTAENRIIIGVWGMRNLLNFAIFPVNTEPTETHPNSVK